MKVIAYISDYNSPPFKVTGTLRTNAAQDGYVIDQGEERTRIFPLAHRIVEVYVEGKMFLRTHDEEVTFRHASVPKLQGDM
uniref:Uncharacterized protein n=1 Tax=viral metagenome TaxID=1070528 RepID=A0A6M3LV22_9ZZZZ